MNLTTISKLIKPTLAVAVSALFFGAGGAAYAIVSVSPTDTYVFTAAAGYETNYNGSSITIDGTGSSGVSSFTFYDNGVIATPTGFGANESITSYDATGWEGYFYTGTSFGEAAAIGGYGTNDSMDIYNVDPPGTWNYTPAGVPDGSSTLPLLLGTLLALAGVPFWHRPRVAALARR